MHHHGTDGRWHMSYGIKLVLSLIYEDYILTCISNQIPLYSTRCNYLFMPNYVNDLTMQQILACLQSPIAFSFYCFVSWHIGCPLCMISPSPLFLHFLSITWHPGEFSPVSARHHLIGRSDRLHRARLCQNSAALLQAIWQIPMTCFDMKI